MVEIKEIKTINLLDVLRVLQEEEWKTFNLPAPSRIQKMKLPDGREDIHSRLWDHFNDRWSGGQRFGNDMYYWYGFNGEEFVDEDGNENELPLQSGPDIVALYKLCQEHNVLNDNGHEIVFWVSW